MPADARADPGLHLPVTSSSRPSPSRRTSEVAGNLHWLGLWDITAKATEGWGPLLLVIYVASQLLLDAPHVDDDGKDTADIFLGLPFLFIPFIVNFKAGLILYWVTTNLWTVGQGIVTRRLVPRGRRCRPQKKSVADAAQGASRRTTARRDGRGSRRGAGAGDGPQSTGSLAG